MIILQRLAAITFALVVLCLILIVFLIGDVVKLQRAHAGTLADELTTEVSTHGTKAAMDLLEQWTHENPEANREQHALVHEIGKANYAIHHGDVQAALAECDTRFWSGCYHGTLQAYFQSLPTVEAEHMNALCPVQEGVSPTNFLRYNCLHGAGHGLAIRFDYDVLKTLAHCDLLTGMSWDRESCYGGVFMENIVSFQQAHGHKAGFITRADLQYPCDAVAAKYAGACWLIQTSAMLTLTGYHWPTVFQECERTGEHRHTCLESVGRDISGYSQRHPLRISALCQEGTAAQREACESGAVKDIVFNDANPEPGFQFCNAYAVERIACRRIVSEASAHLTGTP